MALKNTKNKQVIFLGIFGTQIILYKIYIKNWKFVKQSIL